MDLKSIGLARAGSNPADDAFLLFLPFFMLSSRSNKQSLKLMLFNLPKYFETLLYLNKFNMNYQDRDHTKF
jgi:hypothetical protein